MGSVLERVAWAGLSRRWLGPLLGSTGGWCWGFGDVSGVPGGPVGRWLAVLCLVSLHQVGLGPCSVRVAVAYVEGRQVVGEGKWGWWGAQVVWGFGG